MINEENGDGKKIAEPFLGDTTDEVFQKQTFDRIVGEYGTPTICVPAAGITRDQIAAKIDKVTGRALLSPRDTFRLVVEVNLIAPIYWALEMVGRIAEAPTAVALAAGRLPEEGIQGSVVFIGSISSQGIPGQIAYASTKAGLEGAEATLTKEAIFHGVHAAIVHPGFRSARPDGGEPGTGGGPTSCAPSDMMDGRVGRDPARPRRGRPPRNPHPELRLEVRLRLLRPFPRGGRLRAPVRRPQDLPDGWRQSARSHARDRARSGEGADMILMKPAMPYLDVVRRGRASVRTCPSAPTRCRASTRCSRPLSKKAGSIATGPRWSRWSAFAGQERTSSSPTSPRMRQSCCKYSS